MPSGAGYFRTSYQHDTAILDTRFRWFWFVALLVALVALPFVVSGYVLHLANLVMLAVMAALALNLLTGYAGQLSVGHAAFMASGAFTVVFLGLRAGLPFWLVVPASGAVGAIFGTITGLPALRLRQIYLLLGSLAMHSVIVYAASRYQAVAALGGGFRIQSPQIGAWVVDDPRSWYYVLLVALIAVTVFCVNLVRSHIGRAWLAIKSRDIAAAALGIDVARYKLLAWAFSSALAAVAGALSSYYTNFVAVDQFTIWLAIAYIAMIIVGGLGSILGTFLGAAFVTLLPFVISWLSDYLSLPGELRTSLFATQSMLFGLVIIAFLAFEPQGLVAIWVRIRQYFELWPFKRLSVVKTTR